MRRLVVLALVLASALLAAGPARSANPMKEYADGVDAVKAGRFAEGRTLLESALSSGQSEGKTRLGARVLDYQPSLWLAEACLGLGDLDAAETYLTRASRSADSGDVARLRTRLDQARAAARPAAPAAPAGPPQAALDARAALDAGRLGEAKRLATAALQAAPGDPTARSVAQAVEDLLSSRVQRAHTDLDAGALADAEKSLQDVLAADSGNAAASALLGEVKARRGDASQALQAAQAALAADNLAEAETQARRARSLDASLAGRAGDIEKRARAARSSGPAAVASSTPAPPPVAPAPAAGRGGDQRALVAAVEKALDKGDRRAAGAALTALSDAFPRAPEVDELGRRLVESDDGARGVAAYFRGDLDASIALLSKSAGDDPRLLGALGAAQASRAMLGDRQDDKALSEARATFARALTLDRALRLPESAFSPRVIAIFDDVRRQSR